MSSSHITVGLGNEGTRVGSRIPPGGPSSIFSDLDSGSSSGCPSSASSTAGEVSPPPSQRRNSVKAYKMASNFELCDEQPSQEEINQKNNRRRSKPSVNPLTGELVGCFGPTVGGGQEAVEKKPEAVPATATTPRSTRVPPGGYSTPLW